LNSRIADYDFFVGEARSEVVQNHGDHHTRATDARSSVTDCRVNCDSRLPVGHSFILPRGAPILP
jgi:hypothetical protein